MLSEDKTKFLQSAVKKFGHKPYKNKSMLSWIKSDNPDIKRGDWSWIFDPKYKISRGLYTLPSFNSNEPTMTAAILSMKRNQVLNPVTPKFDPNATSEYDHADIPNRDPFYVPFGEYKDIEDIVRSKEFFPIFISGLSGNGKTFMVEQICAKTRSKLVRVQMSRETDEDDLIGGFRLINGETKFMKGPVLRAMELGAILLIDEADRADAGKVMCLQGVLEGKSYYVKKTGEIITPTKGFNVIVTANTKGKGSMDGRYVAASILDDAWLERFPITIEQEHPKNSIETKILLGYLCYDRECDENDKKFIDHLIAWADIIRKTFEEGAIDEMISTRRLVHIIRTYRMFGERMRAINLCINRFDKETKSSFLELYAKVDPTVAPQTPVVDPVVTTTPDSTAVSTDPAITSTVAVP